MDFYFFHLMPWPHLPADFDTRYDSASVTLPNGIFDPDRGGDLYNRYLDELEYAERLGFEGVCVNEHHQSAYGLMPSPNIIAAALARRTRRAKLAIVGNAIALRDHPLRVAEELAMIDCISGGRVVSGFVRGIGFEHFVQRIPPSASRGRFMEAHDLIVKAWESDEMFSWVGHHYEFPYVNVWPKPLQRPHPPVWIPGTGSVETMEWVAERRYNYLSVYAPARVVKRWFEGFRAAAERQGWEPPAEKIGLLLPIYVAETDARAHEEARPHLEWLFHRGLKITRELYFPPGYLSPQSFRGMATAGIKPFHELTFEELLELGHAVVGSPTTVAEQLHELEEDLGFGTLCALLHFGDMPHHRTVKNMELFAAEVMPALRGAPAAERAAA